MSTEQKVKWEPATEENEFVNEMWELFDDAEGKPKDNYNISFEAMDCLFRNVFRSFFADTIKFLDLIDSSSMSDKTWLAEQKNLRQEGKELRERLTGKEIEEVKINYVARGRNSD